MDLMNFIIKHQFIIAVIILLVDFLIVYYIYIKNDINKSSKFNMKRIDAKKRGFVISFIIHCIYLCYIVFLRSILDITLSEWKGYTLSEMYPATRALAYAPSWILCIASLVSLGFIIYFTVSILHELPKKPSDLWRGIKSKENRSASGGLSPHPAGPSEEKGEKND